jgi:catechol 2,3-dioxygenase-like lactoylglutathione lyase family enzyme
MTLDTVEIKAFVPAKDFELSKRFYVDLGFEETFSDDSLAYLRAGSCSFLLQRFYVTDHASNFTMHLLVVDVDAWWRRVEERQLVRRYGVRCSMPEDRPWAIRDFTLVDPSGVLWRIGTSIVLDDGTRRASMEPSVSG